MTAASSVATAGRRAPLLVAAGIFLSRLTGLVRERLVASVLGVGLAADAFRAALRIPNLLQNLLGEGVLSASFIPVYARLLEEGRREDAGRVAGALAGLLAAVAAVVSLFGVLLAEPLVAVLTPGLTGERFELTVTLTRVLFPGVGLLVLSAWCLGVLNSHRRFFLSYVAPVLWNAAQVAALVAAALVALSPASAAVALAWGAVAGSLLQLAVQLPAVRRLTRPLAVSVRTDLPDVRSVLARFAPVVVGRGVVQLLTYVDLLLASFLAVGALAALGYAQVLYVLPVSLFGMSVAAAELPELSRLGPGERTRLAERVEGGLDRVAFYVVPVVVAYVLLGDLVVAVLFRSGRFGSAEVMLVWAVLAANSVGLLANTRARLLQSVLYAGGDTRTPALVAGLRVVVAAGLGAVLMLQLDRIGIVGGGLRQLGDLPALAPLPPAVRTDPDLPLRLGAVGLALASGCSAWLELVLLRRAVRPRLPSARLSGTALARTLAAGGVAAGAAVAVRPLAADLPLLAAAGVAGLVTGGAYLVAAGAAGVPEASTLVGWGRRRRGR